MNSEFCALCGVERDKDGQYFWSHLRTKAFSAQVKDRACKYAKYAERDMSLCLAAPEEKDEQSTL
jgi:hypothetical protein